MYCIRICRFSSFLQVIFKAFSIIIFIWPFVMLLPFQNLSIKAQVVVLMFPLWSKTAFILHTKIFFWLKDLADDDVYDEREGQKEAVLERLVQF